MNKETREKDLKLQTIQIVSGLVALVGIIPLFIYLVKSYSVIKYFEVIFGNVFGWLFIILSIAGGVGCWQATVRRSWLAQDNKQDQPEQQPEANQ
ncbi:hypothetical protein [Gallaecimonas pentaromativorans]|uniref:Uncharacterized protein n=1 Tax=Gallaecimonas pentaromativorans TaxID=584787 RepID=A0A3N1PER6_9GAMM|nr:hypothetical protein [Gallaecimonas pentaromativorans]ROQ25811.1 hypothetical protein EDC28_105120 [Gallaecimonas pentaromativorans]